MKEDLSKTSLSPMAIMVVATVATVGLVLFILALAATPAKGVTPREAKRILYQVPTPTPVEVLWVDTAGNLGMRGVEAVVPGVPSKDAKLSDSCRAAATRNGEGTLTVCFVKDVGETVAKNLGGFL